MKPDRCKGCPLYFAPGPVVQTGDRVHEDGPPTARLVLVGEAPSNEEVRYGAPFVGPAGRVLGLALRLAGIERKQTYVTNVVKCMSGRTPTWQEVKHCTDAWLWEELEKVGPTTVVALGSTAWRAFHEDPRGIEQ